MRRSESLGQNRSDTGVDPENTGDRGSKRVGGHGSASKRLMDGGGDPVTEEQGDPRDSPLTPQYASPGDRSRMEHPTRLRPHLPRPSHPSCRTTPHTPSRPGGLLPRLSYPRRRHRGRGSPPTDNHSPPARGWTSLVSTGSRPSPDLPPPVSVPTTPNVGRSLPLG